jgi:hypothetical protein
MSVAWLQKTAKGYVPPRTFENQDPYPDRAISHPASRCLRYSPARGSAHSLSCTTRLKGMIMARSIDVTNFEPRELPEKVTSPTSRAHAVLGGASARAPRSGAHVFAPCSPAPSAAPGWTVSTGTGLARAVFLGRMLALPFAFSVAPNQPMVLARY